MGFRNGQWVKFDAPENVDPSDLEKVHQTKSGQCVGIYQRGGVDILGESVTEHVVPVDARGQNIFRLVGPEVIKLVLDPTTLTDLQPVLSRDDVPAERLKTSRPDWVPAP
jgi:hypothetical protein